MSQAPLVSVIIPIFNAERFLTEAVESVFAQTYRQWELFLVDDGSTDGSEAIARAFVARDPRRVRYLEHPGHVNRGLPVTRNLALREAAGEYVAPLDADDVWAPEKLKEQVALLESNAAAAVVFGNPLYWRSWSGDVDAGEDASRGIWTPPGVVIQPPEMLLRSYPLGPGGAPCPSDLLIRRELLVGVGGFEEEFVGVHQMFEDQAFLAKIYLRGGAMAIDRSWTRYRIHPDSIVVTVKRSGQYHTVRRHFLVWLKGYLKEQGVRDPQILRALRRALEPYDPRVVRWLRGQARRGTRLLRRLAPTA